MISSRLRSCFGRASTLAARSGLADFQLERLEERTMLSADLSVAAIGGGGAFASASGGVLLVNGSVENRGDSGADGFLTRIVLSFDRVYGNADDVEIGVIDGHGAGGIGAGGAFDLGRELTVPAGLVPGAYYLIASTDTGSTVAEESESNNTRISEAPSVVINAASGPNLTISVTSPVITVGDDDSTEDAHFTATTTVRNLGTGSPNDFRVQWVLTRDSIIGNEDDILIEDEDISRPGGVAGGASFVRTDIFEFPLNIPAGQYRLGARVDWTGVVGESNEGDNTAVSSGAGVVINGGAGNPNLTVSVSTPSVTLAGDLNEDQHFTGTAIVRNTGTGNPGEFRMTWILTLDAIVGNADDIIVENEDYHFPAGVVAGTPLTITEMLEVPPGTLAGNYRLAVRIDGTGIVSETNESDNTGVSGAAVSVARPDVSASFSYTGGTFAPGSAVTGTLTLRNTGQAPSGSFRVTVALSTDGTSGNSDDVIVLWYDVEDLTNDDLGLAAGEVQTIVGLRLPISWAVLPGSYRVIVRVDSGNSVGENNENNNSTVSASANVVVPARDTSADPTLPDLGVFAFPVAGSFLPGATVIVPAQIINFGGSAAADFDVRVYLSLDGTLDASDILIENDLEFDDDNFVPGGVYTRQAIVLPLTLAAGNYNVILVIDDDDRVNETGDDNNRNRSGTSGSTRVVRPAVTVEASDASGSETSGSQQGNGGVFRVRRSGSTASALTVSYSIGGTATAGADFTALTGTLTFQPGQNSVLINVGVLNDSLAEESETVVMTLVDDAAAGYSLGSGSSRSSTVTIADNEPTVSISASDGTAMEPGVGVNNGRFMVSRTGGETSGALTVSYTVSGTATAGSDYTVLTGTVTFAPGAITAVIDVAALADAIAEDGETVIVTLDSSNAYRLASQASRRTATVVIAAGGPTTSIRALAPTVSEGRTGSQPPAVFRISRTGSTSGELTVRFTLEGSAVLDTDFAEDGAGTSLHSGVVTIPAGSAYVDVRAIPTGDGLAEEGETIVLSLTGDDAYRLAPIAGQRTATVTIIDDEPTVRITSGDGTASERASGSPDTATYIVSRVSAASSSLLVRFRVAAAGTAAYGDDYALTTGTPGAILTFDSGTGEGTLLIPAGAASASLVLTAALDSIIEVQETAVLELLSGAGLPHEYRVSSSQWSATTRINNLLFADASVAQIFSVTPSSFVAGAAGQSITFVTDLLNLGTATITQFTGTYFLTTAGGVRINLGTRTFTGNFEPLASPRVDATFNLAGIAGLVAGTYTPGVVFTTVGDARTVNNTFSDAALAVTFS